MINFFKCSSIILIAFGLSNFLSQEIEYKTATTDSLTYKALDSSSTRILIEDFEENRRHPYYEEFTTNPDSNFIKGLYYLNKAYTNDKKLNKTASNYRKKERLIFTLISGENTTYDTLYNCVHPNNFEKSKMGNIIPVSGKLTDGIWSNLNNNPKGNTSIELYLREKPAQTKIDITTLEGTLIENLVNKYLEKGNYSYKWKPGDDHNGKFFMHVYTDKLKMTYLIDVE